MNNYEKLLTKADKEGISVVEVDFRNNLPCAKCHGNKIYINGNVSTQEKYCVLAEELGHYKLTVGNITNLQDVRNVKQELLARKWGYNQNVGILGLIRSFENGCRTSKEIADFLGVTESYLEDAIDYYRCKYGVSCKIDNYEVRFIPNLMIGKFF